MVFTFLDKYKLSLLKYTKQSELTFTPIFAVILMLNFSKVCKHFSVCISQILILETRPKSGALSECYVGWCRTLKTFLLTSPKLCKFSGTMLFVHCKTCHGSPNNFNINMITNVNKGSLLRWNLLPCQMSELCFFFLNDTIKSKGIMGIFISLEKHSLRCLLLELLIDRTKISI